MRKARNMDIDIVVGDDTFEVPCRFWPETRATREDPGDGAEIETSEHVYIYADAPDDRGVYTKTKTTWAKLVEAFAEENPSPLTLAPLFLTAEKRLQIAEQKLEQRLLELAELKFVEDRDY